MGRSLKAPSSTIARQSRLASDSGDAVASSRSASGSANGASIQGAGAAGAAMDRSAPLISGDVKAKALREKREGKAANWIAADGAPRPELVEVLRQQCDGQLSRGITDSMFSKSHSSEKDFYAALTLLSDFISSPTFAEEQYGLSPEETIERIIANSDLIFKYVSIRLTDNNTSLSLKCLDILEHLVALLSTQQYHMSDYEAVCILPCLTAKFGDAKVAFRDRIREIFRKMTFIFPPSKLLTSYLENGLPSKNARVRTECLSEVGYLFSKNGLQVCSPSRTLPVIAKQISDRDANVRTAALSAIGEAYKIIGDEVYKLVGALPGKEMSMLEERLKRTTVPSASGSAAGGSAARPAPAASAIGRAGPRASVVPPSSAGSSSPGRMSTGAPASRLARPGSTLQQPAAPSAGVRSRLPAPGAARRESAIGLPRAATRSSTGVPSPRSSMLRVPSETVAAARPTSVAAPEREELLADELPEEEDDELSVDQAINLVVSNNVEQSVLALKHVEAFIREEEPQLILHVDQLAIVLSKQMQRAFAPETGEFGNERLKKHLLVVSTSLFDKNRVWEDGRTLGSYLSRSALIPLLTVLLQQLIQSTSRTDDATAQNESKFLNVIVLRCFSACNLNLLYGACLQMLTEATEDLRELEGEVLETRSKFSELLVKCLWKIAKRLEDSLAQHQVEPQQLFADVESFLQAIAPSEWRQRAQDGVPLADLPLRTVKIILSHTSNHFGEEALGMLDMIPQPENSYVYKYLIRMLNIAAEGGAADKAAVADVDGDAEAAAKSKPTNGSVGHERNGSQNGSAAVAATAAVDEGSSTHHAELRDIFQRISNKSESRQGIRELYEFQKRNPHLEKHVENSLQKTGPIFQRFIKRALANHAAEDPDVVDAAAAAAPAAASAGVEATKRVSTPSAGSAGSGTPCTPRSTRFSGAAGGVNDGSIGSPTSSATQSPRGSSIRSSAADDRLAQLRAKFSS